MNLDPTRFKCVVCGKLTGGRIPARGRGDGSFRFPRRHRRPDGKDCPGNILEAEWVDLRGLTSSDPIAIPGDVTASH